jgi:5-methylcytosine-specific restriction endonuclease McrA
MGSADSPAGRRVMKLRLRDGDNCQLCGQLIDFTLPMDGSEPGTRGNDRLGASIDHRIPLAAGGSSHLANLQLAHGICNNRKGSKRDWWANSPPPSRHRDAWTDLEWFESWSAARP